MRALTETGLKTRYRLSYEAIKGAQLWTKYARKVDSTQPDGETYRGAKGVYGPTEKKGERIQQTIPTEGMTITNKIWKAGLEIEGMDWRHGKTSDAQQKVDDLSPLMAVHPGELMETVVTAATSLTCADGTNFFGTTHPVDGSTMANKWTKSTISELQVTVATKPTSAEWADALLAMATKMMLLKDDAGNKVNLGAKSFGVLVPSGLYPSLLKALAQQHLASGESNVMRAQIPFSFDPILLPEWSETDDFILIPAGKSAIIYQVLEDPKILKVLGPGSEHYAKHDEVVAIASGAYNVGVDRWQGAGYATFST